MSGCPYFNSQTTISKSPSQKSQKVPQYYGDYLGLNTLLQSQHPVTSSHEELLFIIIHQTYELWFKQILHELGSVKEIFSAPSVSEKTVAVCVHRLDRVNEILRILVSQFTILETMTPEQFLSFRDSLNPASGFQSVQFRLLENLLGLRSDQRLNYHQASYTSFLNTDDSAIVCNSENNLSLFDLVEQWLERTPFLVMDNFNFWSYYEGAVEALHASERDATIRDPMVPDAEKKQLLEENEKNRKLMTSIFNEDVHKELVETNQRRLSYKAVQAALLIIFFQEEPVLTWPFRLITALCDIDKYLNQWRYRHAQVVHRMVGNKIGTGGSSGYRYLKSTVDRYKVFSDFNDIRSHVIPRHVAPPLDDSVLKRLNFVYRMESNAGCLDNS